MQTIMYMEGKFYAFLKKKLLFASEKIAMVLHVRINSGFLLFSGIHSIEGLLLVTYPYN